MKEKSLQAILATICSLGVMGCGPGFAPPNAPGSACPSITKAQFDEAVAAGAAVGKGKTSASNVTSLDIGPGASRCSSGSKAVRRCIRPNDLVIEYQLADAQIIYVKVPKDTQYRFKVSARPTPCEIIQSPT